MVTDAAEYMKTSARILQVSVAHALNLIVRKSLDLVSILADLREESRKIVTCFQTGTTSKERRGQGRGRFKMAAV